MPSIFPAIRCRQRAVCSSCASKRTWGRARLAASCLALATMICGSLRVAVAQTSPAAITTLTMTSGGSAVTTVASGSVVTLTAEVQAGTRAITLGQVDFCDAAATYCTDIHLLGTAQLTKAGTATFKFRPGVGSHSYKAVFTGTTSYAASTSGNMALAVTGLYPTVTTIAQSTLWRSGSNNDLHMRAPRDGQCKQSKQKGAGMKAIHRDRRTASLAGYVSRVASGAFRAGSRSAAGAY